MNQFLQVTFNCSIGFVKHIRNLNDCLLSINNFTKATISSIQSNIISSNIRSLNITYATCSRINNAILNCIQQLSLAPTIFITSITSSLMIKNFISIQQTSKLIAYTLFITLCGNTIVNPIIFSLFVNIFCFRIFSISCVICGKCSIINTLVSITSIFAQIAYCIIQSSLFSKHFYLRIKECLVFISYSTNKFSTLSS